MALDWKPTSKWWYARISTNGKLSRFNLGVEIEGKRPPSITKEGDRRFEASRERAREAHKQLVAEIRKKANLVEIQQRLLQIKGESRLSFVKVAELPDAWEQKIDRPAKLSPRYVQTCRTRLERFAGFIGKGYPKSKDLVDLTASHLKEFLSSEEERGVSPKTWNDILKLLRECFRKLVPDSAGDRYLRDCPAKRNNSTVHRDSFSPEELRAILDACRGDDFIRPIIMTGIFTAMRKGDCCQLKWEDVDLSGRFIAIRTGKTGKSAQIPLFEELAAELDKHKGAGSVFCFPAQREMYRSNPDGITRRVRNVLTRAGFVDEEWAKKNVLPGLRKPAADEVRKVVTEGVRKSLFSARMKNKALRVFECYQEGNTYSAVQAKTGYSRGAISGILRKIESLTGVEVVRRGNRPEVEAVRGTVNSKRVLGVRRASKRDFHSFRVSWVSLALANGVDAETIRKVTGHTSSEVLLKHYDQRSKEVLREQVRSAMPSLLSDRKSPKDAIREMLREMKVSTWRKDRNELLKMVEQL